MQIKFLDRVIVNVSIDGGISKQGWRQAYLAWALGRKKKYIFNFVVLNSEQNVKRSVRLEF